MGVSRDSMHVLVVYVENESALGFTVIKKAGCMRYNNQFSNFLTQLVLVQDILLPNALFSNHPPNISFTHF